MVNVELTVLYVLFCCQIIAGMLGLYFGNLWRENIASVFKMYLIFSLLMFLFIAYFLSDL